MCSFCFWVIDKALLLQIHFLVFFFSIPFSKYTENFWRNFNAWI